MARIERAEREIGLSELYRICGVLDVEPSDLLQAAQDVLRK
ncbi:helix-turn-helix domain-containing protein (plasmid) [Rhodococcus opacus]|nr:MULTISPECIES: helix-turn-helix domain-containing protein [Rhodococcus]UOT08170.1 helix-turn-helix domain-containing protein [Rhodococcus opacus]